VVVVVCDRLYQCEPVSQYLLRDPFGGLIGPDLCPLRITAGGRTVIRGGAEMSNSDASPDTYSDLGGGITPTTDSPDPSDAPACICDGTGTAGIVLVDGRDVVRACLACKPHLAGKLPTLAQLHTRALPRRRRLALVR
jgi:hypothetical protein